VHLETAANFCVPISLMSKSHRSRTTFLTKEGIHYSRKGIYNSAKTYQINRGANLNILCLQAFNLAPKMGRQRSATRSSIAVATRQGRKIVVSFINKQNTLFLVKSNPELS